MAFLSLLVHWCSRLLAAWRLSEQREQKLEEMFVPGNQVRSKATGRVYEVKTAQMCYAILRSPEGTAVTVDWLTIDGSLDVSVADRWELVTS